MIKKIKYNIMENPNPLITPKILSHRYPILQKQKDQLSKYRNISKEIIKGRDPRLVVFAGPCSIHNLDIALEYAQRLRNLSKKVIKHIFLIMRVFLEKPRTKFGWKGFLYDPFLDGSYKINDGLISSRKLLLKLIDIGIPIATEFLDPMLAAYHQDMVTWGMIGARSSASQIYRQFASQLPMPVGFKNETCGAFENALSAVLTSRFPQLSLCIDENGHLCSVKSKGNPFTHMILRGANDMPNYDYNSVSEFIKKQSLHGLSTRFIIDCAHGNSQKNHKQQEKVFNSILKQKNTNPLIMGMMIESNLKGGNILSITDPCLDWDSTENLIIDAYKIIENHLKNTLNLVN